MAWLDALRAVAALLVVYAHLTHYLFRGARQVSAEWLNAGTAGVMLFFLVSGYIIPASLERHGSLRRFWVSRLARLYPLYLVVGVLVVLVLPLDPYLAAHPATAAVAHATMLPHLLGVPLVTPVVWTLTFEMAFYLIVAALFALRLHRASAAAAVLFALAAVATAPLTPRLLAGPLLPAVVAVGLVAGLLAITGRRRAAVLAGAVALLGLALTLLVADQDPAHVWDGLLIPAVMFTGTTVYRAEHGQIPRWHAAATAATVGVACVANWWAELASLDALNPRYMTRSVITLAFIGGAFAIGMAGRHRRVPRSLAWVGLVSYSVYLVHVPMIELLGPTLTWLGVHLHGVAEVPAMAAFLALLLGVAGLSHRFVERPGQRLFARAHDDRPAERMRDQRDVEKGSARVGG
jgi:peptidoglycan/LPS O-acetylase OafA/YrhL